jgi:hypothetical protein
MGLAASWYILPCIDLSLPPTSCGTTGIQFIPTIESNWVALSCTAIETDEIANTLHFLDKPRIYCCTLLQHTGEFGKILIPTIPHRKVHSTKNYDYKVDGFEGISKTQNLKIKLFAL